eukprot:CAMPEP_0114242252 /NCGR_PEP_ID=MMETSP0058-20121206/10064_1 /TAXON_ID=36894 /ORGANISM="Pyramimonas parkeae, CCMP726" /LENGTH=311 /DNA_ID=CAMNT_0001354827 /DNA_START=689 /DNA_END=1624 /DNA_ORIENTATION=+
MQVRHGSNDTSRSYSASALHHSQHHLRRVQARQHARERRVYGDCASNLVRDMKFARRNVSEFFWSVPGTQRPTAAAQWGKCALVGNSGSLTRTKYGRAIDAHDVVARMNQGPTKNYEALVGARTTHRMLNNVYSIRYSLEKGQGVRKDIHVGPYLPREAGVTLVATRMVGGIEAFNQLLTTNQKHYPTLKALKLHRRGVFYTAAALKGFRACERHEHSRVYPGGSSPSTGLIAVALLYTLCEKTTLFGFGGGGSPEGFPFHYFNWMGTERQFGNEMHSFEAEEALLRTLADLGEITMCDIEGCVGLDNARH